MTSPLPITVPEESARDFDALFESFYARLARLLYRVTGDTGRAEEIASEAFYRLHRKPPSSQVNLEGWLYRTGLRLALDHLKKEQRRARYESLAAHFRITTGVTTITAAIAPDRVVEQSQDRARIRAAITALKPEQVSLILLRGEGLSYAELADALSLNPASVGTLLARAEAAFRKEYVTRYGER
jgi:RNA polymerase sigma-70 factor (ECF subfamily)